jgi:flagellar biosynthesis/type III secretory pathway M-ring protein FliF/YscJ
MKIFLFIFFSIINKISPIKEYEFGSKDYCKTHKSSFIWSKNAIIIAIYETILVFITFLNCLFLYIRKIIINRRERNNRINKKKVYMKKN